MSNVFWDHVSHYSSISFQVSKPVQTGLNGIDLFPNSKKRTRIILTRAMTVEIDVKGLEKTM